MPLHIGSWRCGFQFRAVEAIPLHEQTLADRERVLGPDHPSTLGSRNNLAVTYVSAGRAAEAIPLQEQTLAALERVLSPDHPDTLQSRDNLAITYMRAGRAGRGGDPAIRADAGRQAAGPGPGPPRHPDLAEQPRRRLPSGGPGGLKWCMPRRRAERGL